MEKLLRFFISNSLLVNFMTVIVIIGGIFTLYTIKKEARPPVSMGRVYFSTVYPGASPKDIEKLITIPIEDELAKVEGIKRLISTSYTGLSRVFVEIDPDVPDEEAVISSLYRAINRVKDFPDGVDDPEVFEVKTDSFPVLWLVLYSDKGTASLHEASDIIENNFNAIDDVADAEATGKEEPVFNIETDPEKLNIYNLSLNDIFLVLKNYNLAGPAGSIVSGREDTQVRFDNELDTVGKIENLVIRVNEFGKGIRIRDVARVRAGFEDKRIIFTFNGKTAMGFSVRKTSGADTIVTVKKLRRELDRIKKILPKGVGYEIIWDDSFYVEDTLKFTTRNAVLGLILILIVLFVGLNSFRMSFVTALGLPIAFLGSIIVIYIFGFTINMMTLIGIILVIGMLVDDGIVVAENIYHAVENGLSPHDAAVEGTRQVAMPVFGAVSTTIIAFIPLIFMKGIMGKFMAIIPVAVISALTFSLIECFFILPNHIVEAMHFGKKSVPYVVKPSFLIQKLEKYYTYLVQWVVSRKWHVTIATVVFMICVAVATFTMLKVELFSVRGVSSFSVIIKGRDNIPLKDTLVAAEKVEKAFREFIPHDIKAVSTQVGSSTRHRGVFLDIGTNYAMIKAYFPDLRDRVREEEDVLREIRESISQVDVPGFEVFFDVQKAGPPTGKPVDIEVQGEKIEEIIQVAKMLKNRLLNVKGLIDINDTLDRGKYEYRLKLNQKNAHELGVLARDIQLVAMSAFEGVRITSVRKGLYDCDIRVIYPKKYRDDIDKLLDVKIPTRLGTYVPLRKVVEVEKAQSPSVITRISQKRFIGITADVDNTLSSKQANNIVRKMIPELTDKYPGVRIKLSGEEAERIAIMKDLGKLAFIAFLAIYMIVSLIFGSMRYPLFIVMAIPFGFAGAMIALMTHGVPISISVLVALVGLSGVVVNDSILLIRTIIRFYKDRGLDFEKAVIEGAKRRLRPIFLTSVTTLAGLFPAAYELFGVNAFMRQMSLVMSWGLLFATILTMFSIPAIICVAYGVMNRLER